MAIAAEHDFVSIGQLASRVQRPVRAIEAAADKLQIQPAMRLNGVSYFDGRQVDRITEQLRKGK
jgi:hypothetical protein